MISYLGRGGEGYGWGGVGPSEENAVIYGKIKMADFVYWFGFVILVPLCISRSCGGQRGRGW